jgi:NADPH:quinone reductase-like Zn-dependent oxidoreductase
VKAVRFYEYGAPEVLTVEEFDEPEPEKDAVLLEVKACALNHVDLDIRDGSSRLPVILPHTLGLEFAGVVQAVGSDVRDVRVGDRVTALHQVHCGRCPWCLRGQEECCENTELFGVQLAGGYSTHVVVPSRAIIPIPENLSFANAAAAQTTFSTAWHALRSRADLHVGETVLVNAAGSGVGIAAVQVAQLLGGRVLVSAGSDEKVRRGIEAGAEAGVNYRSDNLGERVLELTDGRGVDVVMECVGGDVLAKSLEAVAKNGRVVTVGAHGGEVVPIDVIILFRQQASLLGSVRATFAEIKHIMSLVGHGFLKPVIHEQFPLEAAAEAHIALAKRANYGKILLLPELGG